MGARMGCSLATESPPSFSTWAVRRITLGRDSESVQTGEDAGVTLKVSKAGFPQVSPQPPGAGLRHTQTLFTLKSPLQRS